MKKRVLIVLLMIILVAGFFWTQSRYPALDEKALMVGAAIDADSLSFNAILTIEDSMPMLQKIPYATINWIYTNKEGMTFGLILAALFLTLLHFIPHHHNKNTFLNTFKGTLIGAPLGVCVNCSAPIAKAMYKGGSELETSLATMFSSPTLNIIVITLLFTLFPLYLATTKTG